MDIGRTKSLGWTDAVWPARFRALANHPLSEAEPASPLVRRRIVTPAPRSQVRTLSLSQRERPPGPPVPRRAQRTEDVQLGGLKRQLQGSRQLPQDGRSLERLEPAVEEA